MIIDEGHKIVEVVEKIDFDLNLENFFQHEIPTNYINYLLNNSGNFEIERNLNDDTFNVLVYESEYLGSPYTPVDRIKFDTPYFNLNNKYEFSGDKTVAYENKKNNSFFFHRSTFGDTKFSDIETLVVGIQNETYINESDLGFLYWNILKPRSSSIVKNYVNDNDTVFNLKAIKKIKFNNSIRNNWIIPKIEYDYNNLFLVPSQINQFGANKTIFTVYADNVNDSDFYTDWNLTTGKLYSNSLPNSFYKTIFFEDIDLDQKFNDGYKIGTIDVVEHSFYDYEKSKVVKEIDSNSDQGETIPFNFSGNLFRTLEMSFNSTFEDLELSNKYEIESPILDSDNGIVELTIDSNHYYNFETFLTIKNEYLNLFSQQFISLKGIERLANGNE